jgi:peptidoglycan/xylan/chitin deacetylase (PgdA/CDA1 family)/2-polyprenyl-3-methyl-5-hydroxy-6-metoxy-1,4-benzoquinol methylase
MQKAEENHLLRIRDLFRFALPYIRRRSADLNERDYWNQVFAKGDPWNYASFYEQTKYQHTLELLPDSPVANAIELGCAEGVFTEMLAGGVDRLLAIDISDAALERARNRCIRNENVSFVQHDLSDGMIGADYDLVVCSEILYYLSDRAAIENFARQVWNSMKPGGHLLMTHSNMVSDDKFATGFDFNEIGAKDIGAIFASCLGLEFLRELRTDLYRVQLFRRAVATPKPEISEAKAPDSPREILLRKNADFEHPAIKWDGCIVTAAEARHCWVTKEVPVLMYHRVAKYGPAELAPYRIAPEAFERQLAWLQRYGFHSISLDEFFELWFTQNIRHIPGKPIVLTFDDAYADFYHNAWPLLRRYGFGATIFVPTDYVGGSADWDISYGSPAQIMSWDQIIELHGWGIHFGSHSCGHKLLTKLSKRNAREDATNSSKILNDKLGIEVSGYCYPYASASADLRRMIERAGYRFAVGGTGGNPPDREDPFYIPRIEIFGSDSMDDFIAKLPKPKPAEEAARSKYHEMRFRRDRATYMDR